MGEDSKSYVIYTKAGKEEYMAEYLRSTILERYPDAAERVYVPKKIKLWHVKNGSGKRWEERKALLFPNYVFIESSDIITFNRVLYEPKIMTSYHLLGKGRLRSAPQEYPVVPVSDEDMNIVNDLLGKNGIVERSCGIKEGSLVKFTEGPLMGKESIVKKVDPSKHYAIIEMEFLGEKRRISLAVDLISENAKVTAPPGS